MVFRLDNAKEFGPISCEPYCSDSQHAGATASRSAIRDELSGKKGLISNVKLDDTSLWKLYEVVTPVSGALLSGGTTYKSYSSCSSSIASSVYAKTRATNL